MKPACGDQPRLGEINRKPTDRRTNLKVRLDALEKVEICWTYIFRRRLSDSTVLHSASRPVSTSERSFRAKSMTSSSDFILVDKLL